MNFIIAFLINSIFIAVMLLAQKHSKLPARGSLIPGTNQQFIYWQDFYCQKWGNSIGMPLMLATFINVCGHSQTSHWWALYVGIGLSMTIAFTVMCLSANHKPDWGFPAPGKISSGGVIHLIYFCFYISTIAFTLAHWSKLTKLDWFTFGVGLTIYAISWHKDVRSGNFDPLKKLA